MIKSENTHSSTLSKKSLSEISHFIVDDVRFGVESDMLSLATDVGEPVMESFVLAVVEGTMPLNGSVESEEGFNSETVVPLDMTYIS